MISMRVLNVIETVGHTGIFVASRSCARAVKREGWDVGFLAIYHVVELDKSFIKLKTGWKELSTPWQLGKVFNEFDVIHHHGSLFSHIQYFTKTPSVNHIWGLAGRIYGDLYRYVYDQQGGFTIPMAKFRTHKQRLYDWTCEIMARKFAHKHSSVITISKFSKHEVETVLGTNNVELVYIGVDTNDFNPDLEGRFRKSNYQYLYVGDLSPRKGVEVLLYGMKYLVKRRIPDAHLMIVGDGSLRAYLEGLVGTLGLEQNVEFVGLVEHHEMPYYYASCDVYVSADRHSYFPQPFLEAMATGKPAVVPDMHVYPEIMDESKGGLMFKWNDPMELAEKMFEIITHSNTSKSDLIRYAKSFTWDRAARDVIRLYTSAINGSNFN